MASVLGPTQAGHTAFKKRALRPWKSTTLSSSSENPTHQVTSLQADIHTELLEKQLDAFLEIKTKQEEALQAQLGLLEDNRITLGGFFQPSTLLVEKSRTFLQRVQPLFGELKEKEQEILTITQQLQLAQTQEDVKRAQAEQQAEAIARQAAEAKTSAALEQAQESFDQVKQLEYSLYQVEHLKTQLEETVYELEERLKSTHANQALAIQVMDQNLSAEQEGRIIQARLRKHLQQALVTSEQKLQTLEQQLEEKLNEISTLLQKLQEEQKARSYETENQNQIKKTLESSTEKVILLHEKVEQMLVTQKHLLQEQEKSKEALFNLQQHTSKLNNIIESERALRKLLEEQVKEELDRRMIL